MARRTVGRSRWSGERGRVNAGKGRARAGFTTVRRNRVAGRRRALEQAGR
ncbi:MAG: hypothetical protein FWC87_15750 [Acidimicrobiaceae bacterium]|nr:hypothetical protein [Acidimicrobiaceae bacterium]